MLHTAKFSTRFSVSAASLAASPCAHGCPLSSPVDVPISKVITPLTCHSARFGADMAGLIGQVQRPPGVRIHQVRRFYNASNPPRRLNNCVTVTSKFYKSTSRSTKSTNPCLSSSSNDAKCKTTSSSFSGSRSSGTPSRCSSAQPVWMTSRLIPLSSYPGGEYDASVCVGPRRRS